MALGEIEVICNLEDFLVPLAKAMLGLQAAWKVEGLHDICKRVTECNVAKGVMKKLLAKGSQIYAGTSEVEAQALKSNYEDILASACRKVLELFLHHVRLSWHV